MSSMRNAISRRNHKERGQPEERKRLGLLEKHKDYSLRAKDHNEKKAKLKALREKAKDRNEDEFYYGMLSRSGPSIRGKNRTGTVNGDRGNAVLGQEAVRLLKTQDMGYIRTARNQVTKEVALLGERIALMESGNTSLNGEDTTPMGKKIIFVEDEEELELRAQEAEFETEAEIEKDTSLSNEEKNLRKLQRREKEKLETRLQVARERLKALSEAESALEIQRAKMAKTSTVGGVNKHGVKFKIKDRKR